LNPGCPHFRIFCSYLNSPLKQALHFCRYCHFLSLALYWIGALHTVYKLMESNTFNFHTALLFSAALFVTSFNNEPTISEMTEDKEALRSTVLHLDSLFWVAYNTCDKETMATFFTEDVEFYHDKNGLTTSRASLVNSMEKGLCSNENRRLKREAVKGSVNVFALENYGAILSGEHVFYIVENGKERLDGLAKFTHIWKYENYEWKMHRILSYDHGPAVK
jgi:hypothetical protein